MIANLQWLDNYANTQDPVANPLKLLWIGKRPEPGFVSLWEQTYLAYAIDRANHLGFTGGLAHRDAIASLQLKLFSSAPAYPRETVVSSPITLPDGTVVPAGTVLTWSAPYIVGAGSANPGVPGGFAYNKTMADVWTQTSDLTLQRNFAGYYGPEARINLMIGIQAGWTGAQGAYDYLWPFIGVTNFWGTPGSPVPDLAERAGWALDAYGTAGTSSPAGVRAQLLTPATGASFASSAQSFTWSAGSGVTSYRLDLGTASGGSDIRAGVESAAQSAYVTGLPVNGSTVWVRLWSRIDGVLQFTDYSFRSYTAPPPPATLAPRPIVTVTGTGTVQTAPLDAAAGDVLVAFVSSSGPDTGGETMTVAGGGLAWTLVSRVNTQLGVSEIWTATTAVARTGISVTSTHTLSGRDQSLVVVPFAGAAGVGASASANGASGAPSISLTTTSVGSLVYAVGNDFNGAVPRTLGANQAMVDEVLGAAGDTFWVQRLTGATGGPGSLVTLGDTAPTDHSWNFAAVEIIPAPGAGKTIPSITWANPSDITSTTPLGSAQLNANASVPGTFVYTPPAGTILGAGNGRALAVTFYPTDTTTYQQATASVQINVLPGTPTVTWNAPAPITYNTPLSSAQLSATADVPGSFSLQPSSRSSRRGRNDPDGRRLDAVGDLHADESRRTRRSSSPCR